jgi:hypothetical protein
MAKRLAPDVRESNEPPVKRVCKCTTIDEYALSCSMTWCVFRDIFRLASCATKNEIFESDVIHAMSRLVSLNEGLLSYARILEIANSDIQNNDAVEMMELILTKSKIKITMSTKVERILATICACIKETIAEYCKNTATATTPLFLESIHRCGIAYDKYIQTIIGKSFYC